MTFLKNINLVLVVPFFTVILLSVSVPAHAAWIGDGMHPLSMPNLNQGQPVQHEVHVNVTPQQRIEPQHRVEPVRPIEHYVPPVVKPTQALRHERVASTYLRRNLNFYRHHDNDPLYINVSPDIAIPDEGEAAIAPVLGEVVDSIPQDYQVVVVDGVNYLFSEGIYYQRVVEGFEVVEPPMLDQG